MTLASAVGTGSSTLFKHVVLTVLLFMSATLACFAAGKLVRQPWIVAVSGSEPAKGFELSPAENAIFPEKNAITVEQHFVTAAPDGVAHVSWRYDTPAELSKVGYLQNSPGLDAIYTPSIIRLDASDGTSWKPLAQIRWSEEFNNHEIFLEIPRGSEIRSAHWRVVVVTSGPAPNVVVGRIRPIAGSGIPFEVAVFALYLPLAFAVLIWTGLRNTRHLFLGACIGVLVLVNAVAFWFAPSLLLVTPDSTDYINWHVMRTPGYPLFLSLVQHTVGLQHLPTIQINIVLLCYLGALTIIGAMFRYWGLCALFTLFPLLFGDFVLYSFYAWTEALFATGITLAAISGVAVLSTKRWHFCLLCAAGLTIASAVKSAGIVLLIPCAMIGILVRGSLRERLRLTALVLVLPVSTYLLMCSYGLSRTGVFSPQSSGGFALAGQVAWMLEPEQLPPDYRALARTARDEIQNELATRPRFYSIYEYADYTSFHEYNFFLWGILVRKFLRKLPAEPTDVLTWERDNKILLDWAKNAIIQNPEKYLYHVFAHYLALWRNVLNSYGSAGGNATLARAAAYLDRVYFQRTLPDQIQHYREIPIPTLISYWQQQGSVPGLRSTPLEFGPRISKIFAVAVFTFCCLILTGSRLPLAARAVIFLSLFVNAYLTAHALFQVALPRYAHVLLFVVLQLLLMVLIWIFDSLRHSGLVVFLESVVLSRMSKFRSGYSARLSRLGPRVDTPAPPIERSKDTHVCLLTPRTGTSASLISKWPSTSI
jgi:hypothetical protein